VIVEHQHALGLPSRPLPGLKARPECLTERLSRKPARLVAVKPLFEVPEREHEAALARDGLAAAERGGAVKRRHSLREAAKTPQRQPLTQ
jgi:hypothetical protein